MTRDEVHSTCESCGASIYQAHLDSGIARYEAGKLLCAHCVSEFERNHDAASGGAADELAPIELDARNTPSAAGEMKSTRIHGATAATLGKGGAWDDERFRRSLRPEMAGATRCRVFHCRLSEGAIDFMTNQINEWIDQRDDIVVKFVNASIGLFEGKHTEPNLIITVFY